MIDLEARAPTPKLLYAMCTAHPANERAHNKSPHEHWGSKLKEEQSDLREHSSFFICLLFFVREITPEKTWITRSSIFAGVTHNQQTLEVCARVCDPAANESKRSTVSRRFALRNADAGGERREEGAKDGDKLARDEQGEARRGEACSEACLWWINAVLHELTEDIWNMLWLCFTQWSI